MKSDPDFINICLACDDNYAQHAAALIASIIANKGEDDRLRFFILSDHLPENVKRRFREMADQWSFPLTFFECSDDVFRGLRTWRGKYNTYFRLVIHRFLAKDIAKVLYLDCDMIAMTSLAPLFHTDISGKYAAVVAEAEDSDFTSHDSPYFNAGMTLFNLEKYREDDIERKAVELGIRRFSEIEFPDQDILNELFAGNVVFVPLKWNTILFPAWYHRFVKASGRRPAFTLDEVNKAFSDPGIIHYNLQPWRAFCEHPLRDLYWKYLRMTPFYAEGVKKYRRHWMSDLYQRYFRIRLGKKNIHIKLFGVDIISWKYSAAKVV